MVSVALVLLFAAQVSGQSVQLAEKLDEFAQLPCEFVLNHTDGFAAALQRDPAASGRIVIYRPIVQPTLAEKRRRLISSTLQLRGVEADRFNFFLADKSPDREIRTEFWRVHPGAGQPRGDLRLWNPEPPDTTRSFMFGSEHEMGICPTFVPRAFARLILDKPGSIGRIVINIGKDPMLNRFWFAEQFVKELVEEHGVPRQRLRLVFRKTAGDLTTAEFWFVPARKKQVEERRPR